MKRNSPERDGDSIGRYIDRRRWLLTLAFFIFVILAMLLVFVITGISGGFGPVPFNLHSVLEADYGVDQFVFRVPPVLIDLIEEIIRDAGIPVAQGYVATVEGSLLTPVPTITPSGPQPTPTPTVERDVSPTDTQGPSSTPTQVVSLTPSPTGQPSATTTATLQSSPTSTVVVQATPIQPPPTQKPPTQKPPTQKPPTATQPPPPPPTATKSPPPTATQLPPPTAYPPPPTEPPYP